MGVAEHYDKVYSEHIPMGKEYPSLELMESIHHISGTGPALDLGCGTARNTAYLAGLGFEVDAVDVSSVAIRLLKEKLIRYPQAKVNPRVADITQEGITRIYKVIVCAQVLHHIRREKALELVQHMQDNTEIGGLNTIASFTKDGDFFRIDPLTNRLYLDPGELLKLYQGKGWNVVYYEEKAGRMYSFGSNVTAYLAAIKQK